MPSESSVGDIARCEDCGVSDRDEALRAIQMNDGGRDLLCSDCFDDALEDGRVSRADERLMTDGGTETDGTYHLLSVYSTSDSPVDAERDRYGGTLHVTEDSETSLCGSVGPETGAPGKYESYEWRTIPLENDLRGLRITNPHIRCDDCYQLLPEQFVQPEIKEADSQ